MKPDKPLPELTYKDIVGRKEAARMLGVTPATLDKYVNAGRIPHFLLPETTPGRRGQARFRLKDLFDYMDRRAVKV